MSRSLEVLRSTGLGQDAGRDVVRAEGLLAPVSRRRKLDEVDRKTRGISDSDGPSSADEASASSAAFGPFGKSLDDALADFVMPSFVEPATLRRSVSVLNHCVTYLVPDLEGGETIRSLAKALLQDEIMRHTELIGRVQRGIET